MKSTSGGACNGASTKRSHAVVPATRIDAGIIATDWYALMDWKPIDDRAYTLSEDAYDSIGTP